MKAGDSMTGKSLRDYTDRIPAVGGDLENRAMEHQQEFGYTDTYDAMVAAALLLHEIYDALLASPQGLEAQPTPRDSREAVIALLEQVERYCPCGARPETPNTHPHVIGCPLEKALMLLRKDGR